MTNFSIRAARGWLLAGGLAAAMLTTPAVAQLTTGGAEVRGFLATSGTNVLAAAYGGGLYSSTTSGTSWARIALPGNVRYLTSIAGNTTGIVIVGADEGLLQTTGGGGGTFTQVLSEPVAAVALASDNTTAIAGIKGLGIVRSTNGGASWAVANNGGFDSLDITAVTFHPSNPSIAYAASKPDGTGARGGVFKSTDGGATWTADTGLPGSNNYVSSLTVDTSGEVYAGVYNPNAGTGDLVRQASGGGAWAGTADAAATVTVHRDANAGTTIWQGTRVLGLRTTTAATVGTGSPFTYAFAQSGTPTLLYTSVNAVATFPGNTAPMLMAIKGAGVWQSTTAASPRTWARVNFPGADRVLSAAYASPNVFIGLYAGGVWKGSASPVNTGVTVTAAQADFSLAATPTAVTPFISIWDIAAASASSIYVAAGSVGMFYGNDGQGIFHWNGTVWQGLGSTAGAPYNIVSESGYAAAQFFGVAFSGTTLYASSLTGSDYTRSSGGTWTNVAVQPGYSLRSITVGSAGTPLIALPFASKLLYSNNGTTWTQSTISDTGFEPLRFYQVAQGSTTSIWVGGTQKGVYYSSDTGVSWTRASIGGVFVDMAVNAVGFRPGTNTAFAADFDGNRYCSSTNGVTWKSAGSQLAAGVNAMRVINGTLYYLTDGAGMIPETGTCP
jgi:hypothetical protein